MTLSTERSPPPWRTSDHPHEVLAAILMSMVEVATEDDGEEFLSEAGSYDLHLLDGLASEVYPQDPLDEPMRW